MSGPLAGAGGPRRRDADLPVARRVASWLVWWVLLMAFWVWIDDSLELPELIAGALIAAAAAGVAELVLYQAGVHIRIRAEWLAKAVKLPWQIVQDTAIVLAALWRKLTRGADPQSGFAVTAVAPGDESSEGRTRRALLLGAKSVSPNTYALGLDSERKILIVHHLVMPSDEPTRRTERRSRRKDRR